MLHLLKIEWLKIRNYRAFWVFSNSLPASIFLINYIAWTLQKQSGSDQVLGNVYVFPKVWQTVSWMSSWLLYFPGMLVIMLMANEFTFRTHRQNVIDGLSRGQFVGVKIALTVILAVIIALINFLTAYIFGSLTGGTFGATNLVYIGYAFLQALAYTFFALMLAVLFRRSGLAIIIFILYGIIFEWLISGLLTYQAHAAPYSYFLPLQASDVLIPIPFGNKILYPDAPSAIVLVACIAVYISAYVYFTRKKIHYR